MTTLSGFERVCRPKQIRWNWNRSQRLQILESQVKERLHAGFYHLIKLLSNAMLHPPSQHYILSSPYEFNVRQAEQQVRQNSNYIYALIQSLFRIFIGWHGVWAGDSQHVMTINSLMFDDGEDLPKITKNGSITDWVRIEWQSGWRTACVGISFAFRTNEKCGNKVAWIFFICLIRTRRNLIRKFEMKFSRIFFACTTNLTDRTEVTKQANKSHTLNSRIYCAVENGTRIQNRRNAQDY